MTVAHAPLKARVLAARLRALAFVPAAGEGLKKGRVCYIQYRYILILIDSYVIHADTHTYRHCTALRVIQSLCGHHDALARRGSLALMSMYVVCICLYVQT